MHPGIILNELILKPRNISQKSFANQLGVSVRRVSGLIKGEIGITDDTDYRLSKYLFTARGLWSNLYKEYKLTKRFKKNEEKETGSEGIQIRGTD
jgi:addiction module HigA family antidote